MITSERISELASGKNVRRVAVENFLSTFGGTQRDALLNLQMDARSYRWNRETQAAIAEGIRQHFHGEPDPD
jgi:hypothetical protein